MNIEEKVRAYLGMLLLDLIEVDRWRVGLDISLKDRYVFRPNTQRTEPF